MKRTELLLLATLMVVYLFTAPAQANPTPKVYTTHSGKIISISETHPYGRSLSTISIVSRGFSHDLSETIEDSDPIREVFIGDLDNNGFDEIYIITAGAGSGSYGGVVAYGSNRDKNLSKIHFPEIAPEDEHFTDYMGHDIFSLSNGRLLRTFPLYLPTDTQNSPSGGLRTLGYGLYPGEAMWQLRIETSAESCKD